MLALVVELLPDALRGGRRAAAFATSLAVPDSA